MTPLGWFFHRSLERLLGHWREGPRAPARLLDQVEEFRLFHPAATHDEWAAFAARAIGSAYTTGFARGFEADVRTGFGRRHPSPDYLADFEEPDWRDSPPVRFRR